jgi:hypothetical protein
MPIHVIDSTTMELVANCLDWAKHRRRKAATKTHMRLNLQSLLPSFVIVDTAAEHNNKRARELCADLKSGEIVLFDKGYVDFGHLRDLDLRGVFWVTRAKENMDYEVVRQMAPSKDAKILRDEVIDRDPLRAMRPAAFLPGRKFFVAAKLPSRTGRRSPKSGIDSSAASFCCGAATSRANGFRSKGKSLVSAGNCTKEIEKPNSSNGSKRSNTATRYWASCSHPNKTTRK